jgi:hypothetical protein
MQYERFVPLSAGPRAVVDTTEHVRAHLSSIVDPDDDFDNLAGNVTIEYKDQNDGVMIIGHIDGEPTAPYLNDDFDPDADDDFKWEG